jgi:hypothetical protein
LIEENSYGIKGKEETPCRKRRPKATTGGRAFLYAPGTGFRVPARDRSRRLSFGLGPRLYRPVALPAGKKSWETSRKPMLLFELFGLFLLRDVQRALS